MSPSPRERIRLGYALRPEHDLRRADLTAPAPAGFEQAHEDLVNRMLAGELTFEDAQVEWARILRKPAPLTIKTYAAQLRRETVLLRQADRGPMRRNTAPRRVVRNRPRASSRRVVRRSRARSPGREDPEPSPPPDLSPAARWLTKASMYSIPEIKGEVTLVADRLTEEDAAELERLVRRKGDILTDDNAPPFAAEETATFERLLGKAARDEGLFDRGAATPPHAPRSTTWETSAGSRSYPSAAPR